MRQDIAISGSPHRVDNGAAPLKRFLGHVVEHRRHPHRVDNGAAPLKRARRAVNLKSEE